MGKVAGLPAPDSRFQARQSADKVFIPYTEQFAEGKIRMRGVRRSGRAGSASTGTGMRQDTPSIQTDGPPQRRALGAGGVPCAPSLRCASRPCHPDKTDDARMRQPAHERQFAKVLVFRHKDAFFRHRESQKFFSPWREGFLARADRTSCPCAANESCSRPDEAQPSRRNFIPLPERACAHAPARLPASGGQTPGMPERPPVRETDTPAR